MEFRGRIWTFAAQKVGQFRNSTANERRKKGMTKGQRDERSEMVGTGRWREGTNDASIPVYTLCRRLMCERYDRLVALGSVILVTSTLWRSTRDSRSWWAKKGIKDERKVKKGPVTSSAILYPRYLSNIKIVNSRHDEAPGALTRGEFGVLKI